MVVNFISTERRRGGVKMLPVYEQSLIPPPLAAGNNLYISTNLDKITQIDDDLEF